MSFWKRLRNRFFAPAAPDEALVSVAPVAPPVPTVPVNLQYYPRTFAPAAADDARRVQVFDPALKHYGRAFRPGDPPFADEGAARHWAGLRRLVTDHVLRAIAESKRGDNLILRGSRLLKAWIGEDAREPGDLDWVVDPPTLGPDDEWCAGLCNEWITAVFSRPSPPGVELIHSGVATDDIWTYERAPGRRVVFPWRATGLPGTAVQVDVVFRETLAEPDRRIPIPAADGGCISVRAATPAQSLAWKLAWLATDFYPQGKDLYDAVLLAERFALPRDVLEQTLRLAQADPLSGTASAFAAGWRVDWKNFVAEYPWVSGSGEEWLARLTKALTPTFADSEFVPQVGDVPPALNPEWLTSTVLELARTIAAEHAYDGLPILADALQDAGCDDEDMLEHCRRGGPHSRGCWVIDLIFGKN